VRIALLYATVVLIWGSTWSAIPFQLGVVAEEVSVAYRFALGSLALFVYALVSGRRLTIARQHYGMVVVQGTLMFSANYLFTYYAINFVASGLVAVVFSLIVISNALLERIFFKRSLEPRLLAGSLFGVAGVAGLFWPEMTTLDAGDQSVYGLMIAMVAVLFASLGNMAAIKTTSRGLPVVAVNAHAMAWGALASVTVAALAGREFLLPLETGYLLSLLYLAIFGSAVAFGCYLALLRTVGSARAAYTAILFPPVALMFSTVLEGYQWTIYGALGIALIIAGNWLALTRIKGNE
jgi:drug/metabolite transporter (DMT)-like permease